MGRSPPMDIERKFQLSPTNTYIVFGLQKRDPSFICKSKYKRQEFAGQLTPALKVLFAV